MEITMNFDSILSSCSDAANSVGKFTERNAIFLTGGAVCAVIAVPAAIIAAKTTSTAIAVVGGFFAVSYGIGVIGAVIGVAANEILLDADEVTPSGVTIDGTATVVA